MKILPSCGAFTMDNIFNKGVYVSYSNHDNCMETNRFFIEILDQTYHDELDVLEYR